MQANHEREERLREVAERMCECMDGLEYIEAAEVSLNVFGLVMRLNGVTLHEAMSAVMDYYKRNPDHADH